VSSATYHPHYIVGSPQAFDLYQYSHRKIPSFKYLFTTREYWHPRLQPSLLIYLPSTPNTSVCLDTSIALTMSNTFHISKKHFRPGGIAPSQWTHSVGAVRDTPVADYSARGVKTTRRITFRPPIAVSPFRLTLSVSYFKHTLWCCGQLWPYVGMGSLGTRMHRDCNAMGDAAKISPRVPSTLSSRSVGRWEDMLLPGHEDPRNCVDPGQSEWYQKFGMIECELSLYDKRRWKWDDVYLLRGLPNIYSPSLCPLLLPLYLRTTAVAPWRCTWSSVFEMHLETEIEWTQRCTWRPRSSELRRFIWRLWSIEFRDALWGCERASLGMHLQVIIERDWRSTWRQSIWREARRQLRLYSLVDL